MSPSARRRSSSPAPRGAVPARTRAESCRPVRRSSSSGVAPSRPSTANVQQSGKRAASRRSSRRGSSGTSAETRRSRARTTLASSPATDPLDRGGDGGAPGGGVEGPVGVAQPQFVLVLVVGGHGGQVAADRRRPRGDPADAVPPSDGDLGDDEHRRPCDRVERDAGEQHRPRPGHAEVVVDVESRRCRTPTRRPPRPERRGPADLQPRGLATADQALAAADPRQGAVGRQLVQEGARRRRSGRS